MLEVVRQYAYEQLDRQKEAATFRQRHAAYFLDLVEQHEVDSRTRAHAVWFERLDDEVANLLAAVHWSIERSDWNSLARFQRSTFIYHFVRGRMREMREWLRQADLDDPDLTPANRGYLLMDTALTLFEGGDVQHALDLSGK